MCKATTCSVSAATIKRLPLYLSVLTELQNKGQEHISSNSLAEITQLNSSLVKKDLSVVITAEGKPKLGYDIQNLITDIRSYLVHENNLDAVQFEVKWTGKPHGLIERLLTKIHLNFTDYEITKDELIIKKGFFKQVTNTTELYLLGISCVDAILSRVVMSELSFFSSILILI